MLLLGAWQVSWALHEFIKSFFGLRVQLHIDTPYRIRFFWLTLSIAAAVVVRCSGLLSSADAVCVLYLTSVESLGEERSMVPLMSGGNLVGFLCWMRWCWGCSVSFGVEVQQAVQQEEFIFKIISCVA